jgi:flagellar biogenesis protein FliO
VTTASNDSKGRSNAMYIGLGTVVLILIIILIVWLVRRAPR